MRDGEGSKDINQAPLAEWSKALRSGRSLHSKAQVRILRGAFYTSASMAQLAERSAVNR